MDTVGPQDEQWSTVSLAHPVGVQENGRIELSPVEMHGRKVHPDDLDDLRSGARLLNERRPQAQLLPLSSTAEANPRRFSHLLRVEARDWSAPRDWVVVFA